VNRASVIDFVFVDSIPDDLGGGKLYISIPYATAVHRCLCGCGHEVVTPLSPTDWRLIFDGETVSLDPSIGSWSFKCQSHYWIRRNRVHWSDRFSKEQIYRIRAQDAKAKKQHFGELPARGGAPSQYCGGVHLGPSLLRRALRRLREPRP
jgi:hypothetical protein